MKISTLLRKKKQTFTARVNYEDASEDNNGKLQLFNVVEIVLWYD